jgi:hypothetical protein
LKRPSFQFYPADWRGNAKLSRCSWGARGAWIAILGLLHDSDEYGVLRWPLKDIVNAIGCPPSLVRELAEKDVLKGADAGAVPALIYRPKSGRKLGPPITILADTVGPCWYSSRMVEDEYKRQHAGGSTRFGADGGAPSPRQGEADSTSPSRSPSRRQGDGSSSSSSSSPQNPSGSSDGGGDARARPRGWHGWAAWFAAHGHPIDGNNVSARTSFGALVAEFDADIAHRPSLPDELAAAIAAAEESNADVRVMPAYAWAVVQRSRSTPSGPARPKRESVGDFNRREAAKLARELGLDTGDGQAIDAEATGA